MPDTPLVRHYVVGTAEPPDAAEWWAQVSNDRDHPGRYGVWRYRYLTAAGIHLGNLSWDYARALADAWAEHKEATDG